MDFGADFTHVNGVAVAFGVGVGVDVLGIFPGLRQSAIIPDVAFMRETIGDKSQLAFLFVLLDRIELFLEADFHLGIGPPGNLNDHVEFVGIF